MLREQLKPIVNVVRSVWGTNGVATRLAAVDEKINRLAIDLTRLVGSGPVALSGEPGVSVAPPVQPVFDPNVLLHQSRGAMLREMPSGAKRLLSAGCAGGWYFDWIEQCYGRVTEHIGIEFYSERPVTLPSNVTWITNTASNMEAIADTSVDLVFSGQNLEHLWGHEVAGFLMEAARVIKPGGHLVIDSPNREVTALLGWSHPEHTIELTVAEIHQLLELAGFDVTKEVGLWLCRDPASKRVLAFDPNLPDAGWSVVERLVAARTHPTDSMLWWLEGRRNGRAPDRAAIDAVITAIYRDAWPERVQRLMVPAGHQIETRADGDWIIVRPGEAGVVIYGPYMPLRAGRHRVTFEVQPDRASRGNFATCDICVGPEARVLQHRDVNQDSRHVTLEIELATQEFGGQFRCFSTTGGFAVRRRVVLEEALS